MTGLSMCFLLCALRLAGRNKGCRPQAPVITLLPAYMEPAHELQDSIEQPARCLAQSGRLAAKLSLSG